jgi:diguanylate cyclase (GGDEF)-like protein
MRSEPLAILAGMTKDLVHAASLDASLKTVTDAALDLLEANHASVRLCDRDTEMRVAARSGLASERPPPIFQKGEGILGWAAETGKVARVPDAARDERFLSVEDRGFPARSILSVPIASAGRVLGVFSASAEDAEAFHDHHEELGKLLANCAAQAVLKAELEVLTVTDSQTQAFNRRYLLPRLREEMRRSERSGEPLSVLLMDLDHFKRVNDRFGHGVGDEVLRAFVRRVRSCVRDIDILVRRGGEEFVLVMPSTEAKAAEAVANRIRLKVCGAPMRVRERILVFQSVSIGVASWNGMENAQRLDEHADTAMYEAKRTGRNRVVVAAPSTSPLKPATVSAPRTRRARQGRNPSSA